MYGQSAGGAIVVAHSYANPKSVVRGYIAVSGTTPFTNPTNSSNFNKVAQKVGCANLTAMAELDCMQKAYVQALQAGVDAANPDPQRGLFRPIADGVTVFTNITDRLEKGLVSKAPLIGGFMFNEPAVFLAFDPNATVAPPKVYIPGEEGLKCSIKQEIDKRNTQGMRGYRYLYSGNFTNVTPRYWLAGMHSCSWPCSSISPILLSFHAEYLS